MKIGIFHEVFFIFVFIGFFSARLSVLTAQNHVAVVRHSGDHWSIEVAEVVVQCPVGYRLRVTNTSAYGVAEHGLKRSYKVLQSSVLVYIFEDARTNTVH